MKLSDLVSELEIPLRQNAPDAQVSLHHIDERRETLDFARFVSARQLASTASPVETVST
jgi:hypothetical protein